MKSYSSFKNDVNTFVNTTLGKQYISSIQPRSLFIFSAKVITPQSCGEHQKQCMNSLQASLNEKEIQWPCKKKKNVHHRLKIFSSFFDEKISGQLKHEGSNLHSMRYNKKCFISISDKKFLSFKSDFTCFLFLALDRTFKVILEI